MGCVRGARCRAWLHPLRSPLQLLCLCPLWVVWMLGLAAPPLVLAPLPPLLLRLQLLCQLLVLVLLLLLLLHSVPARVVGLD